MTNKLKLSSKMYILIAVSAIVIAIGMAVGVICHFLAGGFFNWGADLKSFKSVEVDYALVEFDDSEDVKDICDDVFDGLGLKTYYSADEGETNDGGVIVFRFSPSTGSDKLGRAAEAINAKLAEVAGGELSSAAFHNDETGLYGARAISRLCIAIVSAIALSFIYYAIRYGLSAAFASVILHLHNIGIFVSLLSVCRIPVGAYALAFALVLTVVTTVVASFALGAMRRRIKTDGEFAALDALAQTDESAASSLKFKLSFCALFAIVALLLFVMLSISALSATLAAGYAFCALAVFVSCAYGTAFFIPPVYGRIKRIGDDFKVKRARAKKQSKQKDKAGE